MYEYQYGNRHAPPRIRTQNSEKPTMGQARSILGERKIRANPLAPMDLDSLHLGIQQLTNAETPKDESGASQVVTSPRG